jgi:hypothetical protein
MGSAPGSPLCRAVDPICTIRNKHFNIPHLQSRACGGALKTKKNP